MPSGVYKRTDEHRKILSIAQKKIGNKPPSPFGTKHNLGKKHSLETKLKMRIAHLREKAPNWKGGISGLYPQIRTCFQYRQWRSDVFQRDNYTCLFCGQIGYELNADHIKSFAEIIEEFSVKTIDDALKCDVLWNINNGRTLCLNCHKKTDTYLNKNRWKKK